MIISEKKEKMGFGVSEILGIGAVLLIAAAVVIPGLKEIAQDILDNTKTWVGDQFNEIFDINPVT
ncbi:MAG: hypothetical protein PHC31_04160 [Clostridia bacterium]|nr:hypothetical protein [Clostridia bacterium]